MGMSENTYHIFVYYDEDGATGETHALDFFFYEIKIMVETIMLLHL